MQNTHQKARYRIGLISDTHIPTYLDHLPGSIPAIFEGVDLILHAGDIGELWVLDQLSKIAPVVAVYGNADCPTPPDRLPYQQVISVAGKRILLWHSHFQDPTEEMASRTDTSWHTKLNRLAEKGMEEGVEIVVFGHTHIPMSCQYEDILLINPGAPTSASLFARQKPPTVALLTVSNLEEPSVAHIDLDRPERQLVPMINWTEEFQVAMDEFMPPIVEVDLLPDIHRLKMQTYDGLNEIVQAILPLSRLCWEGKKEYISRTDLITQIEYSHTILMSDKSRLLSILGKPPISLFHTVHL